LSLLERERTLFTLEGPIQTREQYLRKVFGVSHEFTHYGQPFAFVPVETETTEVVAGRIGRAVTREERLPPDQGLAPSRHVAWSASDLFLDPRHHDDGQKLFISRDDDVGTPFAVLRSFAKYLNRDAPPYTIDVEPIFSPESFWEFAEEHKGEITSLTFDFTTPNMFGANDEIDAELREFRKREKAEKITVRMKSSAGLNTDTKKVKQSVNYARKGQGTVKARAKNGARYNSAERTESVSIPEEAAGQRGLDDSYIVRAANFVAGMLKR
jgi:hypothetical protein